MNTVIFSVQFKFPSPARWSYALRIVCLLRKYYQNNTLKHDNNELTVYWEITIQALGPGLLAKKGETFENKVNNIKLVSEPFYVAQFVPLVSCSTIFV